MLDRSNADGHAMHEAQPAHWPALLGAVVLVCLVGALFYPVRGYEFVNFDVIHSATEDPHVRGLSAENLIQIFASPGNMQYYPIPRLSYAVDYQLWGGLDHPGGFKLTNCLIHTANVLLVFWLVLRFFSHPSELEESSKSWWDVSAATYCAAIFAIHPLVVEPVTWVAGRQELVMAFWALSCIHFHHGARRLSAAGGKTARVVSCHALATLCCALACLSNAVAAVIPLLITVFDLLLLDRPRFRRILYGTSTLWLVGVVTIAIKKSVDTTDESSLPKMFSGEWLMIILNTYWLNLKSLVWPVNLAIHYDWVFPKRFLEAEVILGAIAVGLTFALIWRLRARKLSLFALLWFGIVLGPASQVLPYVILRADRFLYLPMAGLVVLGAMSLRGLGQRLKGGKTAVTMAVGITGLAILYGLSAAQILTWRDSYSMWERCVEVAPNHYLNQRGFADQLVSRGEYERAYGCYDRALQLTPIVPRTLRNFASLLATCDDQQWRDYDKAIRLGKWGCQITAGKDPQLRHILALAYNNLAIEEAFERAAAAGNQSLADELRKRLNVYRNALP